MNANAFTNWRKSAYSSGNPQSASRSEKPPASVGCGIPNSSMRAPS